MRKENKPTALRISDAKKKETIDAVWTAVNIIFQRRKELAAYRREVYSNLEQYSGNFSFTFNMDFTKVSNKLLIGFIRPKYQERKTRVEQLTIELHLRLCKFNAVKSTAKSVSIFHFFVLLNRRAA